MLLEGLFGGGNTSPPPSNTDNQPTPPPHRPEPAASETTPADEPTDDDMAAGNDDDIYSPKPADDAEEEQATPTPAPSAAAGSVTTSPAPGAGPASQPAGSFEEMGETETAASRVKGDPVARITNLIASYERLLLEPAADETDQARARALELAQNRVLTSLIDNMSTADARLSLLADKQEQSGRVSLINKYYAEAGG